MAQIPQYANGINTNGLTQSISKNQNEISKSSSFYITTGVVIESNEEENICKVLFQSPEGTKVLKENVSVALGANNNFFPVPQETVKIQVIGDNISIIDLMMTWDKAKKRLNYFYAQRANSTCNSCGGMLGIFV